MYRKTTLQWVRDRTSLKRREALLLIEHGFFSISGLTCRDPSMLYAGPYEIEIREKEFEKFLHTQRKQGKGLSELEKQRCDIITFEIRRDIAVWFGLDPYFSPSHIYRYEWREKGYHKDYHAVIMTLDLQSRLDRLLLVNNPRFLEKLSYYEAKIRRQIERNTLDSRLGAMKLMYRVASQYPETRPILRTN